jgi:membrane associated rhomboid family serine protease
MRRGGTISFSFPPFAGWVRRIIVTCTAIFLAELILPHLINIDLQGWLDGWFGLVPLYVMKGEIWQLVTYSFLHAGWGHLFFNMLTLWFIGAYLERDWGPRRFIECYVFCVVGAALVTIAISYTRILGMDPGRGTIGASGGIFGLLMAFGILYADQEMLMFPLPFSIKAKYLVGIWILVAVVSIFGPQTDVANFAHLGGLFFGFLFVKFMPRRGLSYVASEQYFGVRNSYYRWKRKRAAKKFEVYMRQHDRKVTFDEHGNYIPPDDNDKTNGGGKSGWVN